MTAMLVQVRDILPSYRSGALPKVFKVLPKFQAWEEVDNALFFGNNYDTSDSLAFLVQVKILHRDIHSHAQHLLGLNV